MMPQTYLEVGRAGNEKVGNKTVHMGEHAVALLSNAVQANHWDDFLRRRLQWRLGSCWVNLDGIARCHVDVHPLGRNSVAWAADGTKFHFVIICLLGAITVRHCLVEGI